MDSIFILGLNSPAPQSGKSTVASALSERYGATVLSIASGIRDHARECDLSIVADSQGADKDKPLSELEGRTPREILILIGNLMREIHGESYWVDRLFSKIRDLPKSCKLVIIDDVRTQLEGDVIATNGGMTVTIKRTEAVHNPNDVMGFAPEITIMNDGTVDQCVEKVASIAGLIDKMEGSSRDR